MVQLVPDAVALGWAGMWLGLKFKGRIRAILGSLILVLLVPWLLTQMITTGIGHLMNLRSAAQGYFLAYQQIRADWQEWQIIATLVPALLMDFFVVVWAMTRLPQNFRQLAVRR
jgi:hypothetical protein